MKKNVGTVDRYIRFALAIVFFVLAAFLNWWLILISIFFFYTGYAGFCGIYAMFGITTCKLKD